MSDFEQTNFEKKVKASLDAGLQNLDAQTRQLLASARRNALNQPLKTAWLSSWFKKDYWLPASTVALCSLLAVFILVKPVPHSAPKNVAVTQQQSDAINQVAALELLDNSEDIDTATDPDFYLWADEILATEGKAHAA
jgi:negative regulator of sigma E activity